MKITSKDFDVAAESGVDVSEYFDADSGTKRFNVDMPIWALRELDAEATRRGVSRQALVKGWLIDRIDMVKREQKDRSVAV